jgi:hypothetical protein
MLQENLFAESKRTSYSVPPFEITPLSDLENLPKPVNGTMASPVLANRLASTFKRLAENYNLLSENQLIFVLGTLLRNALVIQSTGSDYRADKSPSSTMNDNLQRWHKIGQSDLSQFTEIDDQPKFSFNKTYLLAKKIGFPVKFGL